MPKPTLMLFLFCLALSGFAQDIQESKDLHSEQSEYARRPDRMLGLFRRSTVLRKDKAINIKVDPALLAWVWENEPEEIRVSIPLPDGSDEILVFRKASILTEDFSVRTSDGRKLIGKEYEGLHYQVKPRNHIKVGGLSFREGGVMGMFSNGTGNINIGESAPGRGEYTVSNDGDLPRPNWECGSDELKSLSDGSTRMQTRDKAIAPSCKTVRVFFESDLDLYTKAGKNLSTASTFVTGLFNVVAQIYLNDGIVLKMSGIHQWTTTDPYKALTDIYSILYAFATNRPVSAINGDLVHLLSARSSSLGGVAYTGVLCNPSLRHGFSSIYYQYYSLPNYSWSVNCVSHELGHNFDSKHTHWCGWTLPNGTTGRIDSCAAGEGSCGTTTKPRKGTVMSYCHVTSGGIDLNLGFGPIPGKVMRDALASASCISATGCLATPSLKADSAANKNNSYVLTLTVPANHNAASWQVLEGTTVIQSGTLTGTTAFTRTITISGKANGTYSYSAKLISGSNSTTSASLAVSVNVQALVVSTGICTATGLQAWFGSDGKMRFKFGLSATCTRYSVQVCRYNYSNPSVPPPAGATPVACGTRNGMASYSPTTTERTQGFIERVADPQPANMTSPGMGSWWYSVDVTCTGTGCTTTNRTRTYIFVPGI